MEFKSYFSIYIADYINLKQAMGYKFNTEIGCLKRFDNFLSNNDFKEINLDIIKKWCLNNPNWSINNRARNLVVIKGLCEYLVNNDIISHFVIDKKLLKQNSRAYKPYIFSHEEIKNITDMADNFYSGYYFEMKYIMPFIIRLLYGTGMRLGEALSIEKENIDYDAGIIKLVNTKNNEERLVVLTDDLTRRLKEYSKKMNKNTVYLFYTKKGNKISHSVIEKNFYSILKKCKIERTKQGPRVHDLRFTFITHSFNDYVESGKDPMQLLPILMTYVGHKSIASTGYYLKSTSQSLNFIRKTSEENYSDLLKGDDLNEE